MVTGTDKKQKTSGFLIDGVLKGHCHENEVFMLLFPTPPGLLIHKLKLFSYMDTGEHFQSFTTRFFAPFPASTNILGAPNVTRW